MSPEAELAGLRLAFPLARSWERVEQFVESVEIEGLTVHSVGLLAVSADGREATGSAASTQTHPTARAYFELIERTTLVDLRVERERTYPLLGEAGERLGEIVHAALFPSAPEGADFRFALSNGVAAGASFSEASLAARAELIERDRLLRSWFGEGAPIKLDVSSAADSAFPKHLYDLEVYGFPATELDAEPGLEVAGVFAFPKRVTNPLVYGTAAAPSREQAVSRAGSECLQRLGFLWGEAVPSDPPAFEPTPNYHQEFYLCPRSHAALRSWLAGANGSALTASRSPDNADGAEPFHSRATSTARYADLTPEHLHKRLWVIKALPDRELRLAFGQHPDVDSRRRRRGVHPIA